MQSEAIIKNNIDERIYRLDDVRKVFAQTKRKFLSPAWNTFLAIIDENGEPIATHVCCKYCSKVLKNSVTVANIVLQTLR